MLSAGDTFLIPDKFGTKYLHIVISEPKSDPARIVLVPVTTWEDYKDDSCILDENDGGGSPFLTHRSCIDFQESLVTSEARLDHLVAEGRIKPHKPVGGNLVEKIRSRAMESGRMPNKCLMILDAQNLI